MQPTGFATPPLPSYSADTVPQQSPGGFWRRFVAAIVDGCILAVITFPIELILGFLSVLALDNDNYRLLITVITKLFGVACGFFYTALFYKHRGATPGKLLMGLRVVDNDTGLYIGFLKTLQRDYLGKIVGGLLLFSGFIMVGFRSDKRGLHDLLANTRVIKIS